MDPAGHLPANMEKDNAKVTWSKPVPSRNTTFTLKLCPSSFVLKATPTIGFKVARIAPNNSTLTGTSFINAQPLLRESITKFKWLRLLNPWTQSTLMFHGLWSTVNTLKAQSQPSLQTWSDTSVPFTEGLKRSLLAIDDLIFDIVDLWCNLRFSYQKDLSYSIKLFILIFFIKPDKLSKLSHQN